MIKSMVLKYYAKHSLLRLTKSNCYHTAVVYNSMAVRGGGTWMNVFNKLTFVVRAVLRLPNKIPAITARVTRGLHSKGNLDRLRNVTKPSGTYRQAVRNFTQSLTRASSNRFPKLGVGLGFVGVAINSNSEPTLMSEDDQIKFMCEQVRSVFQKRWKANYDDDSHQVYDLGLESLNFGDCISKGCNAVVYEASLKSQPDAKPLAVKMMFNYDAESNATSVWRAMKKECVPFSGKIAAMNIHQRSPLSNHPNIVKIRGIFADQTPLLSEAQELYPNALPRRLFEFGYGRNMTLFLAMEKYDCTMNEYLRLHQLEPRTSLVLLTQLFEGIDFLHKSKVAHRDLKSDNVMLSFNSKSRHPWLVITDFGCCLTGLKLPLTSEEVNRGGNIALTAPEIVTPEPGPNVSLDYSKSDLWAAGAMAYEIYGAPNPFYAYKNISNLVSIDYQVSQLPPFATQAPEPIQRLIKRILNRNPDRRPKHRICADLCHVLLVCSNSEIEWLSTVEDKASKLKKLMSIVLFMSAKVLRDSNADFVESKLRTMFLAQVNDSHLLSLTSTL